jgi:hypothetical protein
MIPGSAPNPKILPADKKSLVRGPDGFGRKSQGQMRWKVREKEPFHNRGEKC